MSPLVTIPERDAFGALGYRLPYLLGPFHQDEIARVFDKLVPAEDFQMLSALESIRIHVDESFELLPMQIIDLEDDEGGTGDVFFDAERMSNPLHEGRLSCS